MISPPAIDLRPETPEDLAFLRGLYTVNHWDDAALANLLDPDRATFLTWQFFQHRDRWAAHGAEDWIITCQDSAVGLLTVQETPGQLHVRALTLLPPHQRRGIGSAVLTLASRRAAEDGQTLSVDASPQSPLSFLCRRLKIAVMPPVTL